MGGHSLHRCEGVRVLCGWSLTDVWYEVEGGRKRVN